MTRRIGALVFLLCVLLSLLTFPANASETQEDFLQSIEMPEVLELPDPDTGLNAFDDSLLPDDFFISRSRANVYESEPNGAMASANRINDGDDVYGTIAASNDDDFFVCTFPYSGTINFWIECSSNNNYSTYYHFAVYNSSGSLLGGTSASNKLVSINLSAGTYYIRVYGLTSINPSLQYHFRCKLYRTASLSVNSYTQAESNTCGPASMRMMLSYYNISLIEKVIKDQANALAGSSSDHTYVWVQAATLNYYLANYGNTTRYTYTNMTSQTESAYQTKLLNNLLQGYPVQLVLKISDTAYFPYTSSGHYMVLKGMKFSGAYQGVLNDPHPTYPGVYTVPISSLKSYNDAHSGYIINVV